MNAYLRQLGGDQKAKKITAQYLESLPVGLRIQYVGTKYDITIHSELQHELCEFMADKPKLDTSKVVLSPMPGSVVSISVKVGDEVSKSLIK